MTSADPIPMLCHPLWECGELPRCELLPLGPPPGGPGGPPGEEFDDLSLPRGMAVAGSTFGFLFWDCFGSTFGLPFWDCFGSTFGLGPSGFFCTDCPGGNPVQTDIALYGGVTIGIITGG